MKIVVCVTGGIAVYKCASLVSMLKNLGNEVQVIMTRHATEFVAPLTFQTLSKRKVITDMFDESNPEYVGHIKYGQKWDCIVVAPATANNIGKIANGIADDMVTSTIIASTIPVLFVPSMNTYMYENKLVQMNIKKLKELGYYFVEPDSGMLACGVEGKGKFPKLDKIVNEINKMIDEK